MVLKGRGIGDMTVGGMIDWGRWLLGVGMRFTAADIVDYD